MKVIENNIIPFPGFLAINMFGVVFVREEEWERWNDVGRKVTLNHEAIPYGADEGARLHRFLHRLFLRMALPACLPYQHSLLRYQLRGRSVPQAAGFRIHQDKEAVRYVEED